MTDTNYELELLQDAGYTMAEILGMSQISRLLLANEIQAELDRINNENC